MLVKGGHGLENIRLNLLYRVFCRVLFHVFFESQSQFRQTHQHNL
jgi:hypothetical protein